MSLSVGFGQLIIYFIYMNPEKMDNKKKGKTIMGRGLVDLVLSWSIEDVLNKDLYKPQVSCLFFFFFCFSALLFKLLLLVIVRMKIPDRE